MCVWSHSCLLQQVFAVLYVVLFRIAMTAAQREIRKTKEFVAMIPIHILNPQVWFQVCILVGISPKTKIS